ncbi:hypothetical protein [Bordetella sp. 2513F-2]
MIAKVVLLLACVVALYVLVFGARRPQAAWPATRRGAWILLAATALGWLTGLACAMLWFTSQHGDVDVLLAMALGLLGLAGGAGLLVGMRALR